MYRKSNALLLLAMVFFVISLLSALTPVSDFDQDGYLDSLVTEGFLLTPMLYSFAGLSSLLTRSPWPVSSFPKLFLP